MKAESLPDFYMITGKFRDHHDFKEKLTNAVESGNKIVQLRIKDSNEAEPYLALADIAQTVCEATQTTLLLATTVAIFNRSRADGLHLSSQVLFEYDNRPISNQKLLSVSCHTLEEMQQAQKLGADILLLSPVKETSSHPGVPGLGWQQFTTMIRDLNCPVYALGGLQASDLHDAQQAGAQGVAAISSFWK